MDTLTVIALLKSNFDNRFKFHKDFVEEFVASVNRSGEEQIIIKQLIKKLNIILELNDIDCGLKWLEHLKTYDLYSLHIDTKSKNLRLLFTKEKDGKYFLRLFDEKSGKKVTSYTKNIEIALKRK